MFLSTPVKALEIQVMNTDVGKYFNHIHFHEVVVTPLSEKAKSTIENNT